VRKGGKEIGPGYLPESVLNSTRLFDEKLKNDQPEGDGQEGVGGDLEVAVGVAVNEEGDDGGHGAQGDALGLAAAAFEFGEPGLENPDRWPA
jgi:hypothetical protein